MASATKKIELAPDEAYIHDAIREGRAKREEVSMKAIGTPDPRFQSRVLRLDSLHVHRLDLILQNKGDLEGIVIFRAVKGSKQRLIVADGFHRHEVYRIAKRRSIPAIVLDVSWDQIEREATLFAAMANQVTLLSRTKEDVRKAVEMLLSDDECFRWSKARIANHCGTTPATVTRIQAEYCSRAGIKPPEVVVDIHGAQLPANRTKGSPRISGRKGGFAASIGGKHKFLGTDPELARARLDEILDAKEKMRSEIGKTTNLVAPRKGRSAFHFSNRNRSSTISKPYRLARLQCDLDGCRSANREFYSVGRRQSADDSEVGRFTVLAINRGVHS